MVITARRKLKVQHGDHPGCSVVKTPCFHCRGHRFNPWQGNLTSHTLPDAVKKKKKKKVEDENSGAKQRKKWVMARQRGPLLIMQRHSMC